MTADPQPESAPTDPSDVPTQVFDKFLNKFPEAKIPAVVIERLRALLQSGKPLTEKAVTEALFAEEQLP